MARKRPLTAGQPSPREINLGQVVLRAHVDGEYFILEKGGIPAARTQVVKLCCKAVIRL